MNNQNPFKLLIKFWDYISHLRKKQFFFLLILTLLTSFAEVLSLSSLMPFIGAISEPDKIFDSSYLSPFINFFDIKTSNELIVPLAILFGTAAIFAGGLRLFLLWFSISLSNSTGADINQKIYTAMLYKNYEYHINKSSSEIIATITQKVGAATTILISFFNLFAGIFIGLSILLTLFILDPLISSIAVASFVTAYLIIAAFTSKKLSLNSQIIASKQTSVVRSLQEGLGAIRDIIIDASQKIYISLYKDSVIALKTANTQNTFMNQAPRFAVESVAMVLFAVLIIFLNLNNENILSLFPILAVVALGAQRLLPIMQQIYGNWAALKGNIYALQDVILLLNEKASLVVESDDLKTIKLKKYIQLDNLSYKYPGGAFNTLQNINLKIFQGDRIGIIGETGSGKSTLLDIIMGLLEPTSGALLIDEHKLNLKNAKLWQKNIAHVPQKIFISDSTIIENIAFGVYPHEIDHEKVILAAKQANIHDFISNRPNAYNELVGESGIRLSGGQLQRLGIARALYKNASIIIFDEATSSLDSETEEGIIQTINSLSKDLTIIMVAHRVSTLKNCSKLVELKNGTIERVGAYNKFFN